MKDQMKDQMKAMIDILMHLDNDNSLFYDYGQLRKCAEDLIECAPPDSVVQDKINSFYEMIEEKKKQSKLKL